MHSVIFVLEYVLIGVCAAVAWGPGGRAERLGALWLAVTTVGSLGASLFQMTSATAHLIEDGVFALGLLPLAVIYVSYWIGLVTLLAAALFTLEALYLVNEWNVDASYLWINNLLWLGVPLIFLISGVANFYRRRGAPVREDAPSDSAALA